MLARFAVDPDGVTADATTARAHHYAGAAGAGPIGEFVIAARHSVQRIPGVEVVHAHRHGADCNDRCQLVSA